MKKVIELYNCYSYPADYRTEDWIDSLLCKVFVRRFFKKVNTNENAILTLSTRQIAGGKKVYIISGYCHNKPEIRYWMKEIDFSKAEYIFTALQTELGPMFGKSKAKWIWVKVENV